jgi:hydroxymethylglutaryl-CoA reductase (NADPH)
MSTHSERAKKLVELYSHEKPFQQVLDELVQKDPASLPEMPAMPGITSWSEESRKKRIAVLEKYSDVELNYLTGKKELPSAESYRGNIENLIGMTQVPTGIVGPLYINGTKAQGDFFVPMATTEGTLIASYSRGARATRLSGGITAVCTTEGMQRAPVWKFQNLSEVGLFIGWLLNQIDTCKKIVSTVSRYAKLQELRLNMEGNHVVTVFEYTCGDAAGQNMVTICTQAICEYIIEAAPVKPEHWFIESNYSGDKKATAVSFISVRGKRVTTEAVITRKVVKEVLHCTPELMATYWQTSAVAASQSDSIGIQGHVANGLAAIFLACGQDVACVSESHVGITRMEVNSKGDLYVAITLPALVVGTIGGGTGLPTQNECLQLLKCTGEGTSRKFAEICGAVALAGEVSIAAALASGEFSNAHKFFGRKQKS